MLQDIYVVLIGPERRAVRIALWLAFFDQGCASTAIINYAPEVLEIAGVTDYGDATLWSSAITASKVGCIVAFHCMLLNVMHDCDIQPLLLPRWAACQILQQFTGCCSM